MDWVQDNSTYCYQVSVVLAPGTPPYESPRSTVACNQRCSVPEVLITGNNANSCGDSPIDTYDFGDGIRLNRFLPHSWNNGRGIAISGGQIYYTEIDNSNATEAIHVCSYGTDGSGSTTDSRSIPNPNSSLGIQDLDFYGGYLYTMRGWGTQTPEVIKIDPSSGAQIGNAIQIQQNQGFPTALADGFVVLPTSGNFLINQDDRSPIYHEYDSNTGALLTGGLTVNLSAYGEATGVATDGQYLYFAVLAGEGCVSQAIVRTDLNGNFPQSQPLDPGHTGHFEDIEVVVQ